MLSFLTGRSVLFWILLTVFPIAGSIKEVEGKI